MVPDEYRIINHALVLLGNEYQDEREAARTALHALFRQQCRLEDKLAEKTAELKGELEWAEYVTATTDIGGEG